MRTIFLMICILCFNQTGFSKDEHKHHEAHEHQEGEAHDHSDQKASVQKQGKDQLLIKVKGMVCAFCAQGIRKNFDALQEVKKTEVNLDKMEVRIFLNPGKHLTEDVIKKLVVDAGFAYGGLLDE